MRSTFIETQKYLMVSLMIKVNLIEKMLSTITVLLFVTIQ